MQGFYIQLKYFLLLMDEILRFLFTLKVEICHLPVTVSLRITKFEFNMIYLNLYDINNLL